MFDQGLMTETDTMQRRQMLCDARRHLEAAINLLDAADAPGQIAANVDLALHQIVRLLGDAGLSRRDASDEGCGAVPTS